jgi:hypothetical protein
MHVGRTRKPAHPLRGLYRWLAWSAHPAPPSIFPARCRAATPSRHSACRSSRCTSRAITAACFRHPRRHGRSTRRPPIDTAPSAETSATRKVLRRAIAGHRREETRRTSRANHPPAIRASTGCSTTSSKPGCCPTTHGKSPTPTRNRPRDRRHPLRDNHRSRLPAPPRQAPSHRFSASFGAMSKASSEQRANALTLYHRSDSPHREHVRTGGTTCAQRMPVPGR